MEHNPETAGEAAALADVFVSVKRKKQPWSFIACRSKKQKGPGEVRLGEELPSLYDLLQQSKFAILHSHKQKPRSQTVHLTFQ